MAEGGTEEFDLADLSIVSNEPLPDDGQETSFIDDNTQYRGTQYNTGVNLTGADNFPSPEHLENPREGEEGVPTFKKVENAIANTQWVEQYTKTGLEKLSERILVEKDHLYYLPPSEDIYNKMNEIKKENLREKGFLKEWKDHFGKVIDYALRLTQNDGKFYSESTLKAKYGIVFINHLKHILNKQTAMPFIQPPGEQIEMQPMDNEPSKSQPQQLSPEVQRYLDELNQPRVDPIKRLIDADEDELRSLGFADNAIRELRGLIRTSEDFAAVKRDKDMQIQELEKQNQELGKKVNDLVTEYINTTALDVADKDELEKEIGGLKKEKEEVVKKLVIERKKVFELRTEEESQISRMKSLITDVLKNPESEIPLKDRIKLLFKIEGLTVAAIIASITMFFTTLGLSISNSLKGSTPSPEPPSPTPSPEPPSPEPSIPNKVKAGLKKFAEWLKELAKKSLSALPGIIGSIVSFIFKSAGAVVGFLAEHLIILGFIIVSSIIYGLVEGVSYIKQNHKVVAT